MTYWLFTNEWFSAWGTGGNFSLQSQVRGGIYILKHTDINQPQTLPVSTLEKYSWQLPVEIFFHQQPPTHGVQCCLEHCKHNPVQLCWEAASRERGLPGTSCTGTHKPAANT